MSRGMDDNYHTEGITGQTPGGVVGEAEVTIKAEIRLQLGRCKAYTGAQRRDELDM